METLCATFEEWYLGDGTYPPLHKGQKVNLSFYINPIEKSIVQNGHYFFEQINLSEYKFSGRIIRNYTDSYKQIIIIDVGEFKFYIEEELNGNIKPIIGQFIEGTGTLLLDYYIWVENLHEYLDPPNIFYSFLVETILKVKIPEKFIHRQGDSFSSPTSLSPKDYSENDIQEIEDMRNDKSSTIFYILNLRFINEEVAKTFT